MQTQFKSEGSKLFPDENTENDNSTDSSTENNETEQTQSQQGDQTTAEGGNTKKDDGTDTNFADHPRWKQREDDWTNRFNSQEQRHTQELQTIREDIEKRFGNSDKKESKESTEMPAWFNGDEESWAQYSAHTQQLVNAAVKQSLSTIESKSSEDQKRIDDATTYFNTEVATLEADKTLNPQGQNVDRNKLLKTAMDNDLVDSKGRWNYKAAFKLMKPAEVFQAKKVLDEKKQIASATTSENRAESKPTSTKTSKDFQGKSWGDL